MNLLVDVFGRAIKPLFNIGLGQIPGVQPVYMFVWKHFGPKGIRLARVNDFEMYFACHDWAVAPTLMFAHTWEPAETEICKQYIKEGDTVIDAGSYIGYYSILTSKLVGSKGKVYAFEPSPETQGLLQKNLELNNCNNVQVFKGAITEKAGEISYFVSKTNLSGSSKYPGYADPIGFRGVEIKVPTISLDEVIGDGRVDFIKMDIEGAETQAISGMTNIIKNNPDLKMMIEICPQGLRALGSNLEEHIDLLQRYFRLHIILKSGLTDEVDLVGVKKAFIKTAVINLFCKRR